MDKIWLEKNDQLMNDGNPVYDPAEATEAKSPSLDYLIYPTDAFIYVVYQQKTTSGTYKIKLAKFNYEDGQIIYNLDVFTSTNDYSSFDATPVVSVTRTPYLSEGKPKFLVVWRQKAEGSYQDGLYYWGGIDEGSSVTWYNHSIQKLTSTDSQSQNPTVAVYKYPVGVILHHLAWQQGNTEIKYAGIYDNWNYGDSGGITAGSIEIPSQGSGITYNTKPSITVVNYNPSPEPQYNSPKLTWLATFGGQDYFAALRDKNDSQGSPWNNFHLYYSQDGEINYVNINRTDYDNYFAFVYSDETYQGIYDRYILSTDLSTVQSLSSHVRDLQITNINEGWQGMDVIAFDKSTLPYNFSIASTIIFDGGQTLQARSGSVSSNNTEFYFGFGNVLLNGTVIDFKEKNDTVTTRTSTEINNYLETKPFLVNNNSILTYNLRYGVNDSTLAKEELKENGLINFRMEVVDNATGKNLGVLNDISQFKDKLKSRSSEYYEADLSKLQGKEIKLRLVENDNLKGIYAFSKIHIPTSENKMAKENYNKITLHEGTNVTEYSLQQNYPNPFNPTTVVNYQIPKDGLVTLKIYDVLGREVATLINEHQQAGRYNINFDASNLPSGVYIYQIREGDYNQSRKMLLIK